ncbi:hypothetical protein [Azospirillum sp. TSH64]|uniref:hypothetical protein n=1 Tax=Azospirillum sp. TSH64 TaxID=652740 RepID=UPI0011B208CE|nr:hypothetical protein [Azospirillum sp. TSH64]
MNETLYPSIEINLPLDPGYRQVAGRTLVDDDGQLFLGHKGGLGGGRGGQMSIREFAELIKGFVREPILLPDDREERVFVIGDLDADDFQCRLLDYVRECERLRAFAKSRAADDPDETSVDDGESQQEAGKDSGFTPELDIDGTGSGGPTDRRSIRRLHGKVVNALQRELGSEAVNCMKFDMRPDLYLRGPGNKMEVLFEVKASSNTQSWFTALGQLVVYGAMQSPPPRRVLVCPAPLKNSNFRKALEHLNITLVTFEVKRSSVVFHGLDAISLPVPV